jgi:cobalt-zinc-cadmium efflux system outer membrane protein
MKWLRAPLWIILAYAPMSGCHSPLYAPDIKGLESQFQQLSSAIELDRSREAEPLQKQAGAAGALLSPTTEKPDLTHLAGLLGRADEEPKKVSKFSLTIPPELPGANAPPIKVPKDKAQFKKAIEKLYPPLPSLGEDLALAPGPEGFPLSLADLQQLATRYSPAIRAAEAAVEVARGAVRQAITHPNPVFSYQTDTLGTGPAGYQGFAIDQLIKTGNKLQLQGAAAKMDLFNAEVALKKARNDVAYQVRTNYFALLVALENVKLSHALAKLSDELFKIQLRLFERNQAAGYEPMQLRPLALQARFNLIQARNQYLASWRQLAAGLGLPDMPPTEVAGRVDQAVPEFDYDEAVKRVKNQHTDVLTAQNQIQRARYVLRLAQLMPVPDVDVLVLVQKDYTTAPFLIAPSIHVGVPIPVWDQNIGNIRSAEAQLRQALQNLPLAQNNLISGLADAFNRYLTARRQVEISLQQVIDQVRVYQAVYARYHRAGPAEPGPVQLNITDVVVAQQTLATYLSSYITALGLQWTAVVDMGNLLQTEDLFKGTKIEPRPEVPTLEQLESLFRSACTAAQKQAEDLPPGRPAQEKDVPKADTGSEKGSIESPVLELPSESPEISPRSPDQRKDEGQGPTPVARGPVPVSPRPSLGLRSAKEKASC